MKGFLVATILLRSCLSITALSYPNSSFEDRVSHGSRPEIGKFKAVVAVLIGRKIKAMGVGKGVCTGQIITRQWVMSAIHCIAEHVFYKAFYPERIVYYNITVVAGVTDYNDHVPSRQERTVDLDAYHLYPGSLSTSGARPPPKKLDKFINHVLASVDIALLFVKVPFEFNDYVGAIKLGRNYVQYEIEKPNPCYSVGFGEKESKEFPTSMNYVKVSAGGKKWCKQLKDDTGSSSRVYHICSKGEKKANICRGDSGGPLVCGDGAESVSVGVLSYYSLKVDPMSIFESLECGASKKGVATYMFPGHAEEWINKVTGAPNFVQLLKATSVSSACLCVPGPAFFIGVILIAFILAYV